MFKMTIANMDCGGCAKAVTNIIKSVAPNATVEIDVPSKHVTVTGADNTTAVTDALKAGGYPATA